MKNLRLKQEVYKGAGSGRFIARVMVDTGVFHLDYLFDYLIPSELEEVVSLGSRVQVAFNGVKREGIVYSISAKAERAGRLLAIEKVLGDRALVSQGTIDLIQQMAQRWAAHPFDIWRSALPARIIAAEKKVPEFPKIAAIPDPIRRLKGERSYLVLPPHVNPNHALLRVVGGYLSNRNVLLILPDDKDIERFLAIAPRDGVINLSSSLPKAVRYSHYLAALNAQGNIIVGNRSAIMASVPDLAAIIVHREISENHYEPRTPGWNTRDVALIRQRIEKVPLIFTGYGPSSELAREISREKVTLVNPATTLKVIAERSEKGELIPTRIHSAIRKSLKNGPVLCLVPQRGYSSGLICSKCRNIAHHDCGGVFSQSSLTGPLTCARCFISVNDAVCTWCSSKTFAITGKGSARVVEEIGRAFPGVEVKESTADHLLTEVDGKERIVVATAGAQPVVPEGYSGIFLLEALRFLAGIDMRSAERSVESFFATLALGNEEADLGISLEPSHPVVAALSRWNIARPLSRMLREREEAALPPYRRTIELQPSSHEIHTIESGLIAARGDNRLPRHTSIHVYGNLIRIYCQEEEAQLAISFLHEFQRKRSLSGKKLLSMRIDPYLLN